MPPSPKESLMKGAPALIEQSQRRLAAAGGHHIGDIIAWNADRIDVPRDAAREVLPTLPSCVSFTALASKMPAPVDPIGRTRTHRLPPPRSVSSSFSKPSLST
jgi:hypothetical protein